MSQNVALKVVYMYSKYTGLFHGSDAPNMSPQRCSMMVLAAVVLNDGAGRSGAQ